MGKIEKLLDKTRRGEDTNRWVVYAVAVVAIIVILCCSIGLIMISGVDDYLQNNKQIINLYDFYDLKIGENETAVFTIGSSIIGNSVYPPDINNILKSNNLDVKLYNIVVHGDIPLERSLEIQKIIDAKPSLIIYGITYRSITDEVDNARFEERTFLVHDRLNVRNDSLYLFTDDEKDKIVNGPNILYKKTFLKSAITEMIQGHDIKSLTLNYLIDPDGDNWRLDHIKDNDEIIKQVNDPEDRWRAVVTNESTRYKDALLYNVKTLQNASIPVIILNMPLHPLLSEKITEESRQNLFDLLNQTGAKWYDLEKSFGDDFFYDTHHASLEGAYMFSPIIVDIVSQELG